MIKIIFVVDILSSGGAERVMSILANKFSENGFNITILSKTHKPSFYEIAGNVKLVYPKTIINNNNFVTVLFSRLKLYHDIYIYLKTEKPDLVIPFSTTTNGVIIPICKFLGLCVIASEHSNYKVNLKSLPIWFIKRMIYPKANLLTVLTERDKSEYYGKFMNNVVVMPNPLSMVPISTVNLLTREKIILAVGYISPSRVKVKGFDNLLEIFLKIAPIYNSWKLIIAGGGDLNYLNGIIQKSNLGSQVTLIGETKDLETLMQRSSIFAMTSRWEGLPLTIIEAMSQGMACIAFDCFTGPGDIITNGFDGILVEDQNLVQFESKLSELIENQDLRLTLGTNGIETSKKYLPEIIVRRWHKLIDTTLTSNE
jgi:glycosyltransferase involved in cell wall biosynthesis